MSDTKTKIVNRLNKKIDQILKLNETELSEYIDLIIKLLSDNHIIISFRKRDRLMISRKGLKKVIKKPDADFDEISEIISIIILIIQIPDDDELISKYTKNKKMIFIRKKIKESGLFSLVLSRMSITNAFCDIQYELITRHFRENGLNDDIKFCQIVIEYNELNDYKKTLIELDKKQIQYLIIKLQSALKELA